MRARSSYEPLPTSTYVRAYRISATKADDSQVPHTRGESYPTNPYVIGLGLLAEDRIFLLDRGGRRHTVSCLQPQSKALQLHLLERGGLSAADD